MTNQNLPFLDSVCKASPLENRHPYIPLPSNWSQPKYQFGQLVQLGRFNCLLPLSCQQAWFTGGVAK